MKKGQKVYIKYGTYHNPVVASVPWNLDPAVMQGTFERMSPGDEYAVVRVKHLDWPFTHLHVNPEDLTTEAP